MLFVSAIRHGLSDSICEKPTVNWSDPASLRVQPTAVPARPRATTATAVVTKARREVGAMAGGA
jgi:hypothetical protein